MVCNIFKFDTVLKRVTSERNSTCIIVAKLVLIGVYKHSQSNGFKRNATRKGILLDSGALSGNDNLFQIYAAEERVFGDFRKRSR